MLWTTLNFCFSVLYLTFQFFVAMSESPWNSMLTENHQKELTEVISKEEKCKKVIAKTDAWSLGF